MLYLLKHSRPELSNPIRELSRCMSGPIEENMDEMYRVIKWVIDNPDVGWKCKPMVEFDEKGKILWKMSGISDATWGSNKEDGRSVTGYVLYFMGVPIAWKSKAQKHCSLSSSESEYIAISELVKEVQFGNRFWMTWDVRLLHQFPYVWTTLELFSWLGTMWVGLELGM